jgi:hypothetical protein
MVATKKKNQGDRCTPVLLQAHRTVEEKISCTTVHYTALTKSSEWAAAKDTLDVPTAAWLKTANDMGTAQKELDDLLKAVAAKRVALDTLVQTWAAQTTQCLGAVKEYCSGSQTKCKNMGFGTAGRVSRPSAPLPVNLVAHHNKVAGIAELEWKCDGRRHQYMVQHATNPADASTYAAPVVVSRMRFKLPGQTPGAVLHFRVQVLDPKLPEGHSDWTAWVPVTVS